MKYAQSAHVAGEDEEEFSLLLKSAHLKKQVNIQKFKLIKKNLPRVVWRFAHFCLPRFGLDVPYFLFILLCQSMRDK